MIIEKFTPPRRAFFFASVSRPQGPPFFSGCCCSAIPVLATPPSRRPANLEQKELSSISSWLPPISKMGILIGMRRRARIFFDRPPSPPPPPPPPPPLHVLSVGVFPVCHICVTGTNSPPFWLKSFFLRLLPLFAPSFCVGVNAFFFPFF